MTSNEHNGKDEKTEGFGKKLTPEQIERQDTVDSACHDLLQLLAGKNLDWNVAHIGDVIEVCQDIICTELGVMTEMEFYPFIEN